MKTDYFVHTQFIVDDLNFPDGTHMAGITGGGSYAAAGERVWSDHVGFCCVTGPDFPQYSGWFKSNGIEISGRSDSKNCTHGKLVYAPDGSRTETLMPGCGSYTEMQPSIDDIPESYQSCRGMYFYKNEEESFWNEMLRWLSHYQGVSCWEVESSSVQWENREAISEYMKKVSIVSMNITEGRRVTGKQEPMEVLDGLIEMGGRVIFLHMGAAGALCADSGSRQVWQVSAVQTDIADVTGGGNSSTGGFLVGYTESGGDVLTAGLYGSVSASFILNQWGVPPVMDSALREEALRRKDTIRKTRIC